MTLRRAFSLIEIMVVMALIAGILLLARPIFYSLIGADLTKETNSLVRLIHSTYNNATVTGQTLRIVFEMRIDKDTNEQINTYWVEASTENARAEPSGDEEGSGLWVNKDKEDNAKKAKYMKKPAFARLKEGENGKSHVFSKDVRLYGIWVEGMKERLREGTAYLYFSPMGYTQRAQITLTDDRQGRSLRVISTQPLTGEVSVENEETPF